MRCIVVSIGVLVLAAMSLAGEMPTTIPTTQPRVAHLPHMTIDAATRTIRMDCESLNISGPLEFLCCVRGTNEYESVLRSDVKPSHLHLALLMLGLKPGHPVRYDEKIEKWLPPTGAALKMTLEFEKDGKTVVIPANESMRDIKTKATMPPVTWVFSGSIILPDRRYAGDMTGYLVSVVNFKLTPVDFPALESNANETLVWGTNSDVMPPRGTKVTLIIQPAEKTKAPPPTVPPRTNPASIAIPVIKIAADGTIRLHDEVVTIDELTERLKELKGNRPLTVRISSENGADTSEVMAALKTLDINEAKVPATMGPGDTGGSGESGEGMP